MDDQGSIYHAHIETELAAERERRSSMDSRALSIITTSSSLATLLGAIGALVIRGDKFTLSTGPRVLLLLTLLAFGTAAGCGMAANWLLKYKVADVSTMKEMLTTHWSDDATDSRNISATIKLSTIRSIRENNGLRARWIMLGQALQLVALIFFVLTIASTIFTGSDKSFETGKPSHSPSTAAASSRAASLGQLGWA